jgi:hypothetical protein
VISHYPDVHALKWNDLKTHEVLSARKNITSSASEKDVRFLSVLYPAGAPDPLPTISRLSIRDAAALRIEEPEEAGGLTAIAMTKETWDSVTIPHVESGVGEIQTNGRILFAQVDPALQELNQVFTKNVSYLEHRGVQVFTAGNWIYHIGLGISETRVAGYVIFTDRYGKPHIDIQTDWDDFIVQGSTVEQWQPMGGGVVRLWLKNNGRFTIYNAHAAPTVENGEFAEGLNYWEPYGDGRDYTTVLDEGDLCGTIARDHASESYLGLQQRKIPCEPNTTYRLSLSVKTEADSGCVAVGLGNWGNPNSHRDFGYTRGYTDWREINGTWTSGPDENSLDILLFGSPDFSGTACFDGVTLEAIYPKNAGFESGLDHWGLCGDGTIYEHVDGGVEGSYCAHIGRDWATGHYFSLAQRNIPCKPNTTYRLTLWVSTEAESGRAAAALGNWGTPNTHVDFGHIGGYTDWTQISGTWTSGPDETSMDILLYGTTDFSGDAYFDGLTLEDVGPAPLQVTISGPSVMLYKETRTFRADVSRGSGDYRYQWYKQYDGQSHWQSLGTGRQVVQTMFNRSFALSVDITDIITGEEASATQYVESEGGKDDEGIKVLR